MIYQHYANHRRVKSNMVKARNYLKRLLAALPPKTTAEIREQGRALSVQVKA